MPKLHVCECINGCSARLGSPPLYSGRSLALRTHRQSLLPNMAGDMPINRVCLNTIPIPIPSIGKRPIPIPVSIVLIMSVEHCIIRLLLMPLLHFYANSRAILVICTSISALLPHQPANEKASHTYLKARPFILTFL